MTLFDDDWPPYAPRAVPDDDPFPAAPVVPVEYITIADGSSAERCAGCGRPLGDLEGSGQVRSEAGDTERKAAAPSRSNQRGRILHALFIQGPRNAAQLADRIQTQRSTVAARLGELRAGGYVRVQTDEAGAKVEAPTSGDRTGYVHELTPAGRRWVEADIGAHVHPTRYTGDVTFTEDL